MPKKSKKSKTSSKSPSKNTGSKLSKNSISAILLGAVLFLAAVVLVVLFLLGVFDSNAPNRPNPPNPPKPTPRRFDGDPNKLMDDSKKLRRKLRNDSIQKRLDNPNGKMTCFDNVQRDPTDSDPNRKMPCLGYVTDKDDTYSIPPVQTEFKLKNNYGFIPIDKETNLGGDNYSDDSRPGGVPRKYIMSGKQCSSDDQCGWSSESNYMGRDKKTWVPFCCGDDSKCRTCGQLGRKYYPNYSGTNP